MASRSSRSCTSSSSLSTRSDTVPPLSVHAGSGSPAILPSAPYPVVQREGDGARSPSPRVARTGYGAEVQRKLTPARPSGSSDHIVVTADAAASISEVAATIARIDPRRTGPVAAPGALTLRAQLPGQADPLVLPPDAPVGEAWIGSGATVALADAGLHYASPELGDGPLVATPPGLSGAAAGAG